MCTCSVRKGSSLLASGEHHVHFCAIQVVWSPTLWVRNTISVCVFQRYARVWSLHSRAGLWISQEGYGPSCSSENVKCATTFMGVRSSLSLVTVYPGLCLSFWPSPFPHRAIPTVLFRPLAPNDVVCSGLGTSQEALTLCSLLGPQKFVFLSRIWHLMKSFVPACGSQWSPVLTAYGSQRFPVLGSGSSWEFGTSAIAIYSSAFMPFCAL